MKNEQKRQMVENLYKINENRTDKCLDDMIITEALGVATGHCEDKDDFFRVLSALNLLNAAIKDKRWKSELSYGFIKGRVAQLFDQWIAHPVDDVKAYYNEIEGAVFFDVDGVVFSYKRINRSVFECMVTDSQYQIVSTELHMLCEKRDSIIIIPVCINCFSKMETILCGKKDKPETLLILD